MECTQRLECTQELYGTQLERKCPEQIGFLGICGTKYPVKRGPNKVGRDPQTCSIVLNLNSVSRQHAVINILNKKDFMLMDLDSANKTKLSGKTLQPYIPNPLNNGDTVQFGEIFGIFRLLEEDDDLPMTQAIDIPDTPVCTKHVTRLNPITTIPESPDVSDRDDSFITPSQPKEKLKSPSTRKFIIPGKTISIQPVGTNKIDNIYWNSSKKYTSLNLDDSNSSLNDSISPARLKEKGNEVTNDIHELETQDLFPPEKIDNDTTNSIYTANTQLPDADIHAANTQMPDLRSSSSIHTINTQMPGASGSPSIHCMNTQMPGATSSPSIYSLEAQLPGAYESPIHSLDTQLPSADNLPKVRKINEQQDMQFDLCAANKENDISIYNADTQIFPGERASISASKKTDSPRKPNKSRSDISDEIVFFDVDSQPPEDNFESQAILSEDIDIPSNNFVEPESEPLSQIIKPKSSKRNMRIKSDSSTDCEDFDILPTQKVHILKDDDDDIVLTQKNLEIKGNDDDTTDCEDEMIQINKVNLKTNNSDKLNADVNFEELNTQVIELDEAQSKPNTGVDFEDLPTQVLDVDNIKKDTITEKEVSKNDTGFEDLLTQIIEEDISKKKQTDIQQFSEEVVISPFKIPSNSARKSKKRESSKTPKINLILKHVTSNEEDDKYYRDTQDILEDLCTQGEPSSIVSKQSNVEIRRKSDKKECKSASIDNETSPKKKYIQDTSFTGSYVNENVDDFVSNLSSQEVREVIGIDTHVVKPKRNPSDGSDLDGTPKKGRPFKFMDIDLPNSQEIKTSVSTISKSVLQESSSESETENNSEEQCTPILFRKKKKAKPETRIDLTKKFDVETLPTRVITRVRKPTAKIQDDACKMVSENLLKPKFFTEQEGDIDKEIITENITRLKSKNEKSKQSKDDKEPIKTTKHGEVEERLKQSKECNEPNKTHKDDKVKKTRGRPKGGKKTPLDTKTSTSSSKVSKPSDSKDESRLTNTTNESKEIETLDVNDSPVKPKRSTRHTKSTNKTTKVTAPQEQDSQEKPNRSKRPRKAKEPSPEKEVRRSKRQRTVKENTEQPVTKSILKNTSINTTQDKSTVYNMSGSSTDTPRPFKRPALDDSEVASKRTRSGNNASLRATPARMNKTHYVLFTAFPYEEVKMKLEKLGAVVVTDVVQSSVLLTLQIKRTFKLLCAVGLGKPIVGPNWVQACADTNIIVDPWLYLIKDEAAERRFHFSLERTLTGKRNFLKGYNVSSTPSVMPNASEMKLIVECSGGTWKEGGSQWVCVSCSADRALWPGLRSRGAALVSTEFILGGVLRQRVDVEGSTLK